MDQKRRSTCRRGNQTAEFQHGTLSKPNIAITPSRTGQFVYFNFSIVIYVVHVALPYLIAMIDMFLSYVVHYIYIYTIMQFHHR